MLTITPFSPRRNNSDRRQSWPAKPDILPTVRWSAGAHKGGHLLQHLTSPAHCPSPRGCLSQCQSQSTFLHQNLRQQTEDRRQETRDRRQELWWRTSTTCEEESYWSVSVCTMLVWPVDQTSLTCPDLTLDTTSPPPSSSGQSQRGPDLWSKTLLSPTSHTESNHCLKHKHTEIRPGCFDMMPLMQAKLWLGGHLGH